MKLRKGNVFTSVCQEFFSQGGGVHQPQADPPDRYPPGQTPPGQTPLMGRHSPDTPPPADGYCSGRYASYWNALLLILCCYMYKYVDQNGLATMLVSRCYTRAESEESRGGGLCPGVSVRGGLCPGGSLSRGVCVQGGLCPGGFCPGGTVSVLEVSVREIPYSYVRTVRILLVSILVK